MSFKETPIGRIPEDWKVAKLADVIDIYQTGIWGDDPNQKESDGCVYPIIRSTEITHDGKLDLSNVAFRKIKNGNIEKYILKTGDILLVGSSGSKHLIGRAALFRQPEDGKIYLFSNFMIRLRPNEKVVPEFLYYFFSSKLYFRFLSRLQQTSTGLRNLPKKELINVILPLPPLEEQRKIAEILSTVDDAIQKVDEAIAKTERLKKGLMQELLTKGIGHKEFKDTEIGRIPKEWEVVRLSDLGTLKDGDWILKEDYTNEGVRLIQIGDVGVGTFLNKSRRFISPERAKQLNCTFVDPEKDILISRMPDPIGRACLAPRLPHPYIVAVDITILKVDNDKADRNFIVYALNFEATLERVERLASGATRKRISRRNLEKVLIPLPPLPEQQKIAEILSTVDKKLELEKKRKEKLERIKRGLMNDLLTGKRRVKVS